jgi:hypothetical protein
MDETRFQRLARRAKLLKSDYGTGYQTGLRRHYHGKSYGDPREHEARLAKQDEYGRGYRDGFAGKEPVPRMGRPPLPADTPRSEKRVRSVRLADEHWEKLKRLGTDWLEQAIERAKEPADSTR